MRGGVTLSSSYTGTMKEALYFFIANSTFHIIADESVASYIYTCHLKAGIKSPYIAMRSDNFNTPVRSILLKIMFHSDYDDDYVSDVGICRYGKKEKEKTFSKTLIQEVEIQQQVYQDSFKDELTPCEPICPAIITYLINIADDEKQTLLNFIISNLISRTYFPGRTVYDDKTITQTIFGENLSLIAMELMEGYKTSADIEENDNSRVYHPSIILMWAWNLARLKNVFGIAHRDLHQGNLLFNMNKRFYGDSNKLFYGQMIIIDFGRITVRNKLKKPMPTNLSTWRMAIYNSRFNWIGSMKSNISISVFRNEAIEFKEFNEHAVAKLNKMTELRKEKADEFLSTFQTKYGISFQEACSLVVKKSLSRHSPSSKSNSMNAGAGSGAGPNSGTDVSKGEMLRLLQGELNVNVPKASSLTPRAIELVKRRGGRGSRGSRSKKTKSRGGTRKYKK